MKNKFEQNKNPREALLIAKAYYSAGNYKNAEEWALKANNLDKKLDESWLIFAKSQEKLGKRKEALKILVAYYRTSKSIKVKALIDKFKTKSI
jgi:tetratricopeptide (TPR) repeat protein